MLIDYLFSKDGLRIAKVDVSISGVRLARGPGGLSPQTAESLTGALHLTLADLSAALARPEIVDQVLAGVPGIARPEITFVNDEDGGIRIVGSVEAVGRRIPITATTRVRVSNNRLIVSATQLRGVPLLGALPMQLLDLELPISLPRGMTFTNVTTEPGSLVLHFEGHDIELS
ncbi:MAG TPA: DUF2993 domain-containing protein [Jatrophihabitans sp.]|nr:DUF2993 domain-containing protein [Jatrophihabitans sp.]